jgi:translation initiation factor 1
MNQRESAEPMGNSKLVYSTEKGRICPTCGKGAAKCTCRKKRTSPQPADPRDGIIRIRRETKGRKGKGVTVLSGFHHSDSDLKNLAAKLKRWCGTGGSVKDGTILIQGDHRHTLLAELTRQGYQAKLAGG